MMSYDTAILYNGPMHITRGNVLMISSCCQGTNEQMGIWLSIGPFSPLIFFSGGGGCWTRVTITIGRVPGK